MGKGSSVASKPTQFDKGVSGFKGKKHSEETKEKIRLAQTTRHKKPVVKVDVLLELESLKKENQILKKVIAGLVTKYGVVADEYKHTSVQA